MNSDGFPIKDPPGPPTFIALLKEWLREDPLLKPHFYLIGWEDGTYIHTRCNSSLQQKLEHGYALACFPRNEHEHKSWPKVTIFYHGEEPRVRGYLKKEDPLFFDKLREFLILGHDGLHEVTNCSIKYTYEETLHDRKKAINQNWWEVGGDL
jgi:hypothetical protein